MQPIALAMTMATQLLVVAGIGFGAGQGSPRLVGRWDLTLTEGSEIYPSWFEITDDHGVPAGRWQGRGGHASRVTEIAVTGDDFRFLWPSDYDAKLPPTKIEGRLTGANSLAGVTIDGAGKRIPFRGVRAPRLDRPAPSGWEAPVDLLTAGIGAWQVDPPGEPNGWRIENGELVNRPPSGNLVTQRRFTDFRLRLEVNVPPKGNSGIYLRGRHEIQVQDDFGQEPHSRRMGGVYGQVTPTSLPAKPAGEWQKFEITFVGRRVTVVLNGVTIIDDQEIPGITGGALDSDEAAPGPLMLQGDHGGIRYRNILIQTASR
jgi:Domain of Unknown Function (DUF1080)